MTIRTNRPRKQGPNPGVSPKATWYGLPSESQPVLLSKWPRRAGTSDLLRLVMSHGFALTAGGIVLGAAAALGLTRLLGYLLYDVSPRDPLAFGSAFVVMVVASLAACFLPAWRATQTDPVRALRA